jgi:hypothetical protein
MARVATEIIDECVTELHQTVARLSGYGAAR